MGGQGVQDELLEGNGTEPHFPSLYYNMLPFGA